MDNQNQRNLILAVALSALILFGWDAALRYLYPEPVKPAAQVAAASASPSAAAPAEPKHTREGGLMNPADVAAEARDLRTALNPAARVAIDAPGLTGSINLVGGMVDDLSARRHTASLEKNSEPQRIFSPAGTPAQHYAQFGWVSDGAQPAGSLPSATTVWTAPAGSRLTPQSPVTLTWNNAQGQTFTLTYAIDADYMLTVTQGISNSGAAPVAIKPFATIARTDKTASLDSFNVHSGPFGAFDEAVSFEPDYSDLTEKGEITSPGKVNWLGFTDVYWMSTLIPSKAGGTSTFRALGNGLYRADVIYPQTSVAPGQLVSRETRLFAGAKESKVLDRYEEAGIPKFGLAIDWGWFRWFEKPIFLLLTKLFELAGNFGVAIILLTLIVRGVMFPVAQKQFASMAAMRAIQPKMKALQERYKDDKAKQQDEVMALYKREGVNPLAGCLPIFLQIPVFFALYKVLIVAVEMRHQPFALWIKDLSAPDPLHILNLFGLLNFTPPHMLAIGVVPIILGISMYFQFKLNPAPMDEAQKQIFALMPWVLMFVMAPFAVGLQIYWITSNVLTILQQKLLYARHPGLKEAPAK